MTRRMMRAVPALVALALTAAACTGDGRDDSSAVFPLQATNVTLAANCDALRSVPPPHSGEAFEAGTVSSVTVPGTFGLSPATEPLRVTLAGHGEYRVTTWVTNGFGGMSTTFSAGGISDGTSTRQWTLQAPASIQLTLAPGGAFTVVVCKA